MSKYKGLIYCLLCGKKYKQINERGKIKYICSGYSNYKNICKERNIIDMETIDFIANQHYPQSEVERIEIKDKYNFTIYYKDGTRSEVKEGVNYFSIIS